MRPATIPIPPAAVASADRPLRIAQIAPVAAPVQPGEGDSIEQLVSLLTDELVRRGHDVTLYATGGSSTAARLESLYERGHDESGELTWEWDFPLREVLNAAHAFERAGEYDLIHAHNFHFALPFAHLVGTPLVETLHVMSSPASLEAARRRPDVQFVAVSAFQAGEMGGGANVRVIPHGIDIEAFPFSSRGGEYLMFLGRMIPHKGPAEAIRIAQRAGMRLVLAGPAEPDYDVADEPGLDGERIRYVGRVGSAERNRLLSGAAALLFPLTYPEPFGLVLVESMACGTPVLATAMGAVPEIVQEGVTGLTAPSWEGLAELVPAVASLDRATVRRAVEHRFDFRRMVDDHEAFYRSVVSTQGRL